MEESMMAETGQAEWEGKSPGLQAGDRELVGRSESESSKHSQEQSHTS